MEVAIPVDKLKVVAVGDLEPGTYFYALGDHDLAGLGVVFQGPNSHKAYAMFSGVKPFQLKPMGGGGEQRKVIALDTQEIVLGFAAEELGDGDLYALGAVLVSEAGAEMVIQMDVPGNGKQVFGLRLREHTITKDGPQRDFISLKRWKLVSRDPKGNETTLFEKSAPVVGSA